MIPVLLIAGLAGVAVGVAVAVFWKQIAAALKKIYDILPPQIKKELEGVVTLVRKVSDVIKNIFKSYSYNREKKEWTETVHSKTVSADQVPEHIRKRVQQEKEVDISDEVQQHLEEMELSQ